MTRHNRRISGDKLLWGLQARELWPAELVHIALLALLLLLPCVAHSRLIEQAPNLDKPVKCGELSCFQDINYPSNYYYVPERLIDLSFAQFGKENPRSSENSVRSNVIQGASSPHAIHFILDFSTTQEQVEAARKALAKQDASSILVGPVEALKAAALLRLMWREGDELFSQLLEPVTVTLLDKQKLTFVLEVGEDERNWFARAAAAQFRHLSLLLELQFLGVRKPIPLRMSVDWAKLGEEKIVQGHLSKKWLSSDYFWWFARWIEKERIQIRWQGDGEPDSTSLLSAAWELWRRLMDESPLDELQRMQLSSAAKKRLGMAVEEQFRELENAAISSQPSLSHSQKNRHHWLNSAVSHYAFMPAWAADNSTAILGADDEAILRRAREVSNVAASNYEQGKFKQAIEGYHNANGLYQSVFGRPGSGISYNLGQSYRRNKQCEQAIEHYKIAAALLETAEESRQQAQRAYSYFFIADCFMQMQDEPSALEYLHLAAGVTLGNEKSLLMRFVGSTYQKLGKHCLAVEAYRESVRHSLLFNEEATEAKRQFEEAVNKAWSWVVASDSQAQRSGASVEQLKAALAAYREISICIEPTVEQIGQIERRVDALDKMIEKQVGIEAWALSEEAAAIWEDAVLDRVDNRVESVAGKNDADAGSATEQAGVQTAEQYGADNIGNGDKASTEPSPPDAWQALAPVDNITFEMLLNEAKQQMGLPLLLTARSRLAKEKQLKHYNLNRYRAELGALRMATTINDEFFTQWQDSSSCVAIGFVLAGQSLYSWDSHLQQVTVRVRKEGEVGKWQTLVVDKERFIQEQSRFQFPCLSEDDVKGKANFEVGVSWLYQNGLQVEYPAQRMDGIFFQLYAPHRYRLLSVASQGEVVRQKNIRHADVVLESKIDGVPISTHFLIRNQGIFPAVWAVVPQSIVPESVGVKMSWTYWSGREMEKSFSVDDGEIDWGERDTLEVPIF